MAQNSVFYLDHLFSHRARHGALLALDILSGLFFLAAVVFFGFTPLTPYFERVGGLLLIVLAFRFTVAQAELYFRSAYFLESAGVFEYERLRYQTRARRAHPLVAFLESPLGSIVMARAWVPGAGLAEFLNTRPYRGGFFDGEMVPKEGTLSSYVETLYAENKDFADFLFRFGVHGGDLKNIMFWYENQLDRIRTREWWWSMTRLSEMKGLGKTWAFAETWKLNRYGMTISESPEIFRAGHSYFTRKAEVEKIEAVLTKSSAANVIIVGPPGVGKKETLKYLAYRVETGQMPSALRYKRVVLLNALMLASGRKSKGELEEAFLEILADAIHARNVILAIDNFPEFIESTEKLGVDVSALLEKFLESDRIHVVALADEYGFHARVESRRDLMSHFEKITVAEPAYEETFLILEDAVEKLEARHRIIYSYLALKEVLDGAKRYYVDGVMPAKALELLEEATSWVKQKGLVLITKADILDLLKEKTSIPMGEIDEAEKEKLLNLEKYLHERVVGQDEAITRIANALRRARTDIQSTNRPIGSFMFLGPTGVGKTETAKALAAVFFGGEEHMLRLDMSEYQGEEGFKKLIGSFEEGTAGILATMIREHPYGVLLLDEFEKSSRGVHDLFLQVFDEGVFSDARGMKVNARNIIFIVTSNAGSNLIFDAVQRGENLADLREKVVNALVEENIFRPEFLNRFDGVILFHPLAEEHLVGIARALLEELARRLDEKRIRLVVNDVLVNTAIKYGHDPRFGAREMRRAIKEKIEDKIAEKIIRGEVKEGDTLELSENDLV